MATQKYVFVYGSLKRGFGNNAFMCDAEFVCETRTKDHGFTMISLEAFPAVFIDGNHAIEGEVYAVDSYTLLRLDSLESNGELYQRILVPLESGHLAWMYCFHQSYGIPDDYIEEDLRVHTDALGVQTWLPRRVC
jgi:gamma-glutamylaminecyclotransferase